MAASTYKIALSNGQAISVYQAASQAVNTSPVVTMVGVASSTTTTTDFAVSETAYVTDIVVTTALTAGGIEVYNVTDSRRSGKGWNDLETYLNTNTTRKPIALKFIKGKTYRFIQSVAGNA